MYDVSKIIELNQKTLPKTMGGKHHIKIFNPFVSPPLAKLPNCIEF